MDWRQYPDTRGTRVARFLGGCEISHSSRHAIRPLCLLKLWVDLDNVVGLHGEGHAASGHQELVWISMDLDGNDIYIVEAMLKHGCVPSVHCGIQRQFGPPIDFRIKYDPRKSGSCYDISVVALRLRQVFSGAGYRLSCNTHSGSNAFSWILPTLNVRRRPRTLRHFRREPLF